MMEPVSLDAVEVKQFDKPWAACGQRGRDHRNIINSLSLNPEELEQWNFSRYQRYEVIKDKEVMYEEFMMDDADICIVAFGIAARVCKNAIVEARKQGVKVGMIRPITLWPFPDKALKAAAEKCKAFISVELNMGQMIDDVKLAIECKKPVLLCNRTGGMIMSPDEVVAKIQEASKM